MKPHPNDILISIATDLGERILTTLGTEEVKAVFISGSIAKGGVAWYDSGDRFEIYSDVDLSVVVSDVSNAEEFRKRARSMAGETPLEDEHFRVFRRPDVGVYTMGNLLAQPARPGTVDIANAHRMLFGDRDIPQKMRTLEFASIDKTEALYLIENRLIEQAEVLDQSQESPSPSHLRYTTYLALKACMDAGAALLIFLGRYDPDPDQRVRVLKEVYATSGGQALFPAGAFERIIESHSAVRDLEVTLAKNSESLEAICNASEELLLSLWKGLAARILPLREKMDWDSLVFARCREGEMFRNLREFVVLARRLGIGRARGLLRGMRSMRFSPVESLRLSGAVETLLKRHRAEGAVALEGVFMNYLDRLTRSLGDADGGTFRRARRLFHEIS